MLQVRKLESGYGAMQVLWGPDLEVEAGSVTSLLGPNGAGKPTLLWTVLRVVKAEGTPEEIKQSDEIREAYLGI